MLKNVRISVKLVVIGTIIMIVPLAAVAVLSVMSATSGLGRLEREQITSRTREIATLIDKVYSEENKLALSLANDRTIMAVAAAVASGDAKAIPAATAAAIETLNAYKPDTKLGASYEGVIVVGRNGHVIADYDPKRMDLDLSARDYVKAALDGKESIGDAVMSKVSGQPITPVAVPISVNGNVVGACVLVVQVGFVNQLIASEKIGTTGYAFVIDRKGFVVAHPQAENVLKLNIHEQKGMEALGQAMTSGKDGVLSYVFQGVPKTAGFYPVAGTGWSVALGLPDREFLQVATDLRNLVLAVSAAAVVLAFLVYLLFSRTITKPLSRGVTFAEQVAGGDFTKLLPIAQRDEVGKLATALNTMSSRLREMVSAIQSNAEQVAASSEQISASAHTLAEGAQSQASTLEQTSASVEELTASVDQVSEHAQSQAAAVEQGSSSMNQVQMSIEEVSRNLQEIASLASKSVENAQSGAHAVSEVVEGINLIAGSSEKIGGIVTVISDIADQTNLLALNASIEAARAGEHGRGFAVVADEVSKLADRSSSSTKEIENLIKESVKNVTKGVEIARSSQVAMEQIRSASQKVKEMIGGLSESMTQQVGAVKELSKALASVSEMSQSISAATEEQTSNAKQVSKAVENVNEVTQSAASAAEEMSSSTQNLSVMAQDLQRLTAQFKISDDELSPSAGSAVVRATADAVAAGE